MLFPSCRAILLSLVFAVLLHNGAFSQVDLSDAKLYVVLNDSSRLLRTKEVLVEEVVSRTSIRLPDGEALKNNNEKRIVLALESDIGILESEFNAAYVSLPSIDSEGFKVCWHGASNSLVIVGKDERGLLYGVGYFLRKAELSKGRIFLREPLHLATTPRYPIRGHQLGYRPKTNSYDAFSVAQFDQYIRELALFGANSIEIMPPRTDDVFSNRHMKLPAIEMAREQARIAKEYGMDVWMWYPNLEKDYSDAATVRKELEEREKVFKILPKLNALFAPGGDPGDLEPDQLFEWMGQVAQRLNKYHPEAKIWISPQSFRPDTAWFDAFFRHVNKGYPWLGGVVFGPWVKIPIEQIRARVRKELPIRNYPDITHSLACQYPVPDWDKAWAVTLGREAINPRPYDQKLFHNAVAPYCIGSLSYSEGTNDDVNKFIWSDQDWDPETDVMETLKDYSRLFFGHAFALRGAHALVALEENHRGDLASKTTISQTLFQWQSMEREASEALLRNPRFQMGLIRAYYDAYTSERLIYETHLERRAVEILQASTPSNVSIAIGRAKELLESAWDHPIRPDWKQKCMDLADSLFRSIGAQLTVEKHGGMPGRGNFIDAIQYPLNDGPWLISELDRISGIPVAEKKVQEIKKLLSRTDPGPGGFYDHLASLASRKRVVSPISWQEDPGSLQSPRTGFGLSLPDNSYYAQLDGITPRVPLVPSTWNNQIEAIYDTPLKIRYENLDPEAAYQLKVVYTGRFKSHLKLMAGEGILIHDYIKVGEQPLYEFDIPREATRKGAAEFTWTCKEAERGVQVAELWLIKKSE